MIYQDVVIVAIEHDKHGIESRQQRRPDQPTSNQQGTGPFLPSRVASPVAGRAGLRQRCPLAGQTKAENETVERDERPEPIRASDAR